MEDEETGGTDDNDAQGGDEVEEETTEENGTGGSDEEETFDAAAAQRKIRKANNEAKNLRDRVKALEPLARQAQEAENAGKDANVLLTEERDRFKAEAETSGARLMQLEVAMEHAPEGMSPKQVASLAKRLTGTTVEELEEDAVEVFALFNTGPKPAPKGRPKERLRSGAVPEGEHEETDPAKLAAGIPRSSF